ncbi:PREDICTED: protein FAM60A isoform X2 [Nicrophorus vespilloides]|uniref:Protein FAM60A isoform X2 n=1 Tax=Nicrophorus vespilloides TaxID=110193 RepID=A0ABM1MZS0_NICVS|nr:PREDICTED: protein FAM60A isoform X2 [Nicrophorus vespilloides]
MFPFHKPKVYRSSTGCCICKAKSSSSRFTDSKKYEEDFNKCFQLPGPRQGEICNACVLLVKRWKKLPAGSERNWKHVVDSRAGPGMKSMTKFKSKHKKQAAEGEAKQQQQKKKKQYEREMSPTLSDDKSDGGQDVEMADVDYLSENVTSGGSSRTNSPGASDCEESVVVVTSSTSRRHKSQAKRRSTTTSEVSEFIDMDYWKKLKICCGIIFEGPNGEMLIDERYWKPCRARLAAQCKLRSPSVESNAATKGSSKGYSDSSSDSGYDDSNQGTDETAAVYKKHEQRINSNRLMVLCNLIVGEN